MTQVNFALLSLDALATDSGHQTIYVPSRAIDGDQYTVWLGNPTYIPNQWIKIELGAAYRIASIRLLQDAGWTATSYNIDYSNNGTEWTRLETHTTAGVDETFDLTTPITAKWWRFWGVGPALTGLWGIISLELLGVAGLDVPVGYAYDVLDAVVGSFGADVEAWMEAHGYTNDLSPAMWVNLCVNVWTILRLQELLAAGGGGGGAALEDIQAALDAQSTDIEGVVALDVEGLDASIDNKFTAQAGAMGTALSILEGNVGAAITVAQVYVQDDIAALDPASAAEVTAAKEAIQANIAGLAFATPANVTAAKEAIQANIAGLSFASTGDVNAARDSVKSQLTSTRSDILSEIDTHAGPSLFDIDALIDAARDAIGGYVSGGTSTVTVALADALQDVIDAVGAIESGLVPPIYLDAERSVPGQAVNVTGPVVVTGPMSGVLFQVTVVPPGQSVQVGASGRRFKGLAWCAFVTDAGDWESLQKIDTEFGVLTPHSMSEAAACSVYCKSGATISVRPFVNTV